jgi:hypothetical protein
MNWISLVSFLAFLSARFSRIDFPDFLASALLGDFPDIGITPFNVLCLPSTIHTYIFYASFQKIPLAAWRGGVLLRCFYGDGFAVMSRDELPDPLDGFGTVQVKAVAGAGNPDQRGAADVPVHPDGILQRSQRICGAVEDERW